MSRKMGTGSLGVKGGKGKIKHGQLTDKLKDNEGDN